MLIDWLRQTQQIWTDMPAAETEFLGTTSSRSIADLRTFTETKLHCRILAVAGAAGSTISIQWSDDSGSTWDYFDGVDTPKVTIDSVNAYSTSAYTSVPAGARIEDCYLRIVGNDGNATNDPRFYHIWQEFKP